MKVLVLHSTEDCEHLIEKAARTCYDSVGKEKKSREELIQQIVANDHTSIMEHASITFEVSGISRACSHQLVRHRVGLSVSQRSQRYVGEGDCGIVIPPRIHSSSEAVLKIFRELIMHSAKAYQELRELGIPKEDARYVLPNACTTKMLLTFNFTALRHFLDLRLAPAAQWEIRSLAEMFFYEGYYVAPNVFRDYTLKYPELTQMKAICPKCTHRDVVGDLPVLFDVTVSCTECGEEHTYKGDLRCLKGAL